MSIYQAIFTVEVEVEVYITVILLRLILTFVSLHLSHSKKLIYFAFPFLLNLCSPELLMTSSLNFSNNRK
jgi:hypothetical protein